MRPVHENERATCQRLLADRWMFGPPNCERTNRKAASFKRQEFLVHEGRRARRDVGPQVGNYRVGAFGFDDGHYRHRFCLGSIGRALDGRRRWSAFRPRGSPKIAIPIAATGANPDEMSKATASLELHSHEARAWLWFRDSVLMQFEVCARRLIPSIAPREPLSHSSRDNVGDDRVAGRLGMSIGTGWVDLFVSLDASFEGRQDVDVFDSLRT